MGSKINVLHFFSEKNVLLDFFVIGQIRQFFLGAKKMRLLKRNCDWKPLRAAAALLGMPLPLTAVENNGLESLWTATTHNLLILAKEMLKALMGAK